MRSYRLHSAAWFCFCLAFGPLYAQEPWRIDAPEYIVAVADIHGAHDAFVRILERTGLVDSERGWTGGSSHLVIVGDVLDRGAGSRAALDLIMNLKPQAQADGGGVHLVLGNHEIMNLVGDTRYVSNGELAAFAEEEPQQLRAAALERHIANRGDQDPESARAEFEQRFPVGFFAHREAFSSEGRYGSFLLEQPLLLLAGDTAFVHGGISRSYGGADGEALNAELGRQLRDYVEAMEQLIAASVLARTDSFYDHPAVIERFAERVAAGEATWPSGAQEAAERVEELNYAPVFALASPTWYRGMVSCSPLVERDHWETALTSLAAERIVVGHTPTPGAVILSRMDDRILRIDTGMLESFYGGRAAALVIDDGRTEAIYEDETRAATPLEQPRRVGHRPADLTDTALETLLAGGRITERRAMETRTRVKLRDGDIEIEADFYPAMRSGGRPSAAAYALDRLLGLGMVPVTVARDLDGEPGSLQYVPANSMTETQRREVGVGGSAWCPLPDQFQAMYVFDALIYNEGRGLEQITYAEQSFDLVLLGHERAFGTQRGRPPHLRETELEVTAAWQRALRSLGGDRLEATLGEVLSSRQIRALERRIDAVLEDALDP